MQDNDREASTAAVNQNPASDPPALHDPAVALLIAHVKQARGVDLSAYKPPTLRRRINKRMQARHVEDLESYVDMLQADPDEFPRLFDTVLINVTEFFRDADAWDSLENTVIPQILAGKHDAAPIRVWSAGCSSGQEAYSLAILFAEALGEDAFRARVKIYATDVDEDALAQARAGVYSADQIASVPERFRDRYFELATTNGEHPGSAPEHVQVRADLRRCIIFGRHNVLHDPPISRLDLLLCRNTLMYFNADVQARALLRFHFALNDEGVLFLGTAEKLLNHPDLFRPTDGKRRFFTRVSTDIRGRPVGRTEAAPGNLVSHLSTNVMLRDAALEGGRVAQLTVNQDGRLAIANAMARSMFQIETRDLGRPLQDLEVSYRPAELRAAIDRATETSDVVELRALEWRPNPGEPRYLDIDVSPLIQDGESAGTLITFLDATERHRLSRRLSETQRNLEVAQLDLQTSSEELETMNEELQSTVEELETTNEELRSTNEELETINEQLQSTNDELHVANEELVHRGGEIDEVNAFLGAVLRSFRRAVIVLDPEMLVRVWNDEAEDLWGLRSEEVSGQHLLNLDIGLPSSELHEPLRRCLAEEDHREELRLNGRNRRGMQISCNVVMSNLSNRGSLLGAILLMEEQRQ